MIDESEEKKSGVKYHGNASDEADNTADDGCQHPTVSQRRELVIDGANEDLPRSADRRDGQQDQHEEKEEGEEGRTKLHGCKGLRIDDKGQSRTLLDHLVNAVQACSSIMATGFFSARDYVSSGSKIVVLRTSAVKNRNRGKRQFLYVI